MNVETKIKQQIDEYIGKAGSAIPYNKLLADVLTSIIDAQQPIVLFPNSINERTLSKKSYLKVIDAYKENKMQNLVLSISKVSGDISIGNITSYGLSAETNLNLGWIEFGEAMFPVCLEAVISANEELPIDGLYTTSAIANAFGLSEDDWLALWNGEIVVACPNMDSTFPFDCLGFTDEGDPNTKYLCNVIFDNQYYRYFRVIRYTDEDKWQIISVVDNA